MCVLEMGLSFYLDNNEVGVIPKKNGEKISSLKYVEQVLACDNLFIDSFEAQICWNIIVCVFVHILYPCQHYICV